MFSIGSGIAALYPVAKAIVNDETELTRIHLIAGFRSAAHLPLYHSMGQEMFSLQCGQLPWI